MGAPEWLDLADDEWVRWRGDRATRLLAVVVGLSAVAWVVGVAVAGVPAWLFWGRLPAAAVVGAVTVVLFVALVLQFQTTRNAEYVLTDRALYVRDGATFTAPRRVDHAMIRGVGLRETAFERVLGLGVVVVQCEIDDVWLFGIEEPVAAVERIREVAIDDGDR